MKYTLEEIYLLVGKEDKTAGITLRKDSDAYSSYGDFITVEFIYTQYEREELDSKIQIEPFDSRGYLRAKYLGSDLSDEKIQKLYKEGIHSDDIVEILYYQAPSKNAFHSKEKRSITKININLQPKAKGRDYDWIYGFNKKHVEEGNGLSPHERSLYLACKYYYEPDELTENECNELFDDEGILKENIEWQLLNIKYQREEIEDDEKRRLIRLFQIKKQVARNLLDKYLKQSGSSLKKLLKDNPNQAVELYDKILNFKDRRLNISGKIAIYIDAESFLHIYMRHVEEMKINSHFQDKDNFQWNEEDVLLVMQKVIRETNSEIQEHFEVKPGQRYSRYGKQSVYYQGDYYTFHIESNGRISTFHKNKKEHEK
jgi:hypothetical protein